MFTKRKIKFLSGLLGSLLFLPILSAGPSSAATANVASGIVPTCSGAIDYASRTTDGDINTGNYCAVAAGVTYITLDFGESYNIGKVNLWHYYGDGRKFRDVIVQLSNDSSFSAKTTVFNNDTDNSSGQGTGTDSEYVETASGKEITFTPVNARYMRLYTNGSTVNNYGYYVEVQAWTTDSGSTPTPAPTVTPTPTSTPTTTPTTTSTPAPTPTATATTPPDGTDLFGITKMYPTKASGREWFSNWTQNMAKQWSGTCSIDPLLDFNNGSQYVEIATVNGDKELIISSTDPDNNYPRIYIGNAAVNDFWDNVEVTFYCKAVSLSDNICGWGGLEAVIKTTHYPDGYNNNAENDNCRGYGGRITYDGDADIEKELCHSPNRNARTSPVYPWGDGEYLPLNQWIGYKFIGTTCSNGTKVHLKLYIDTVSNGNPANQQWTLLKEITDEDNITSIWPSGQSNIAASSYRTGSPYVGKALCGSNRTTQKWVYIRTDGVREQRYKYMSIREIDPEP